MDCHGAWFVEPSFSAFNQFGKAQPVLEADSLHYLPDLRSEGLGIWYLGVDFLLEEPGLQAIDRTLIAKKSRPFAAANYPCDFFAVFHGHVPAVRRRSSALARRENREKEVRIESVPLACGRQIAEVTAPTVEIRAIRDACPHRVPVYVANQLQQKRVSIDQDCFKAASKQLPVTTVSPVVALSINPVDVAHAPG